MHLSTRTRALVATTLLVTSGCSLGFVNAPPTGPMASTEPSECTPWRVATGTDLAGGAVLSLLSLPLLSAESDCRAGGFCLDFSPEARKTGAVLLTAGLALFASSLYGVGKGGQCDRILDRARACDGGDATACLRLGRPAPFPSPLPSP